MAGARPVSCLLRVGFEALEEWDGDGWGWGRRFGGCWGGRWEGRRGRRGTGVSAVMVSVVRELRVGLGFGIVKDAGFGYVAVCAVFDD
jgi:hypothetical protein